MTGNDLGAIMTDQEMSDALDVWEKEGIILCSSK